MHEPARCLCIVVVQEVLRVWLMSTSLCQIWVHIAAAFNTVKRVVLTALGTTASAALAWLVAKKDAVVAFVSRWAIVALPFALAMLPVALGVFWSQSSWYEEALEA